MSQTGPEALRLTGVTKVFGPLTAVDDVTLSVRQGEILALLGENGAGKTTLMNILFGHYVPDAGSVEILGADGEMRPLRPGSPRDALAAGIGMVHQHFTLADNLTVLDNILLGTEPSWHVFSRRGQARRRLADLQRRAGLSVELEQPVSRLTMGQKQRVEILKALFRDARILILDEPTAVLTPQEIDTLFDTLRSLRAEGLAVIFISHKLAEVVAISDRVAVMRAGRLVGGADARGVSKEELAEMMVGRPVQPAVREAAVPGDPVLELARVTVVSSETGKPELEQASLTVREHEVIGIAGISGNGQAALSDLVCGLRPATEGRLTLFGSAVEGTDPIAMTEAGVGRIPEDRLHDGVVGDMTLWENAIIEDVDSRRFAGSGGLLRRGAAQRHALGLIDRFDIRCRGPHATIRLLSGGNIQKLILGRVLEREPGLIVANQPTRGLDVGAVSYVHQRLLQARTNGAGILLISEDLDELLALSDRIAVLYRGRLSPAYPTNFLTIRDIGLLMVGTTPDRLAA